MLIVNVCLQFRTASLKAVSVQASFLLPTNLLHNCYFLVITHAIIVRCCTAKRWSLHIPHASVLIVCSLMCGAVSTVSYEHIIHIHAIMYTQKFGRLVEQLALCSSFVMLQMWFFGLFVFAERRFTAVKQFIANVWISCIVTYVPYLSYRDCRLYVYLAWVVVWVLIMPLVPTVVYKLARQIVEHKQPISWLTRMLKQGLDFAQETDLIVCL